MNEQLAAYLKMVLKGLDNLSLPSDPSNLYDPINYILNLGGKRLRPILSLIGSEVCGGEAQDALHQALAVEVFHNFTLVHDDIMDEAPLRRGQETVHMKWDSTIGILSGDAMQILAYQLLVKGASPEQMSALLDIFGRTALGVCEGQQMDMDFESRTDVSSDEYLLMIEKKTAILLGCALQLGSIRADASAQTQSALYDFGRWLGVAFQIHDDILDAFGDPEKFGKQVGGDILSNKKTLLMLNAMELAEGKSKEELDRWLSAEQFDAEQKVAAVKSILKESGALDSTELARQSYYRKAIEALDHSDINATGKDRLKEFASWLMNRES